MPRLFNLVVPRCVPCVCVHFRLYCLPVCLSTALVCILIFFFSIHLRKYVCVCVYACVSVCVRRYLRLVRCSVCAFVSLFLVFHGRDLACDRVSELVCVVVAVWFRSDSNNNSVFVTILTRTTVRFNVPWALPYPTHILHTTNLFCFFFLFRKKPEDFHFHTFFPWLR